MDKKIKIGIIKEGKTPVDHRVPFTPEQCLQIEAMYPWVKFQIQPSEIRCFKDDEYIQLGLTVSNDMEDCDILMGVKEVPKEQLIANKTYFFFSHTIKKQSYNRELLQTILEKNIQLVDYECLKGANGKRVVAFGRFAGIVGAYNALRAYGIRHELYKLKPAHECHDMKELKGELFNVRLKPLRILLTGSGRVTKGAQEVLDAVPVKNVAKEAYFAPIEEAIYIQLDSDAYNERKDGSAFDFQHFYSHADEYKGTFDQYTGITDILIAGAFWDPKAPVLFDKEAMKAGNFNISIVADITCDIEGSIASTIRPSTIDEPFYDYDPQSQSEKKAFSNEKNISVMAVDNLPCELPRDASESFGSMLIEHVIADLIENNGATIVANASITKNGALCATYAYLQDYVDGK